MPRSTATLATEPLRRERQRVRDALDRLDRMIGELPSLGPGERKLTLGKIVREFQKQVLSHLEWEESVLFPLVDKMAGGTAITQAPRHEHRIVVRWQAGLAVEIARETPDVLPFSRLADQLLGLVLAHLENEEEILLPVLDRTMTADQVAHALAITAPVS